VAWDVTVPDTYAETHIGSTATNQVRSPKDGAEQDRQILEISQHTHQRQLVHGMRWPLSSHKRFAGVFTTITEDTRDTTFLPQCLSMHGSAKRDSRTLNRGTIKRGQLIAWTHNRSDN